MADELKPYSGQKTTCIKCGEEGTNTFYCRGGMHTHQCSLHIRDKQHLHRRCLTCSYEWAEKCING